jgi:hypothetical protein
MAQAHCSPYKASGWTQQKTLSLILLLLLDVAADTDRIESSTNPTENTTSLLLFMGCCLAMDGCLTQQLLL